MADKTTKNKDYLFEITSDTYNQYLSAIKDKQTKPTSMEDFETMINFANTRCWDYTKKGE